MVSSWDSLGAEYRHLVGYGCYGYRFADARGPFQIFVSPVLTETDKTVDRKDSSALTGGKHAKSCCNQYTGW
jgi:hypothetical protein